MSTEVTTQLTGDYSINEGEEEEHHSGKLPPSSLQRTISTFSTSSREDGRTAVNTPTEDVKPNRGFVTWNDANDPENPMNFPHWRKVLSTSIVVIVSMNVTMGSSAPSAATRAIAAEFNVSNEVTLLVTSLFLVGYVIGPILWSGLSEVIGRRPVFVGTLLAYTLFNLPQALASNVTTILVTRFFSGFFASAPLTLGGGAMADIWDPVARGTGVAIFSAAVFAGPIAGPIAGAFIVPSFLGWRWIFWIMLIFSGFCWIVCFSLLPETFAPVILQRKARQLRQVDPVANSGRFAAHEKENLTIRGLLERTIFRPFTILLQEPILALITLYLSVIYGLVFALFEVFPTLFSEVRGIKPQFAGLMFLGVGIGTTTGAYIFHAIAKARFRRLSATWRGPPPPEERLIAAMIGAPVLAISIFWVFWTGAYSSIPWYVPAIGSIPMGFGLLVLFVSFQSYIVDTYLMYSASALGANNMARSSVAAGFPLFANQMFHNLGIQWAGTLLGCIALLLCPLPFIFHRYGPLIRAKSRFAPCLDLVIVDAVHRKGNSAHEDAASFV